MRCVAWVSMRVDRGRGPAVRAVVSRMQLSSAGSAAVQHIQPATHWQGVARALPGPQSPPAWPAGEAKGRTRTASQPTAVPGKQSAAAIYTRWCHCHAKAAQRKAKCTRPALARPSSLPHLQPRGHRLAQLAGRLVLQSTGAADLPHASWIGTPILPRALRCGRGRIGGQQSQQGGLLRRSC